jgi:hypothetical protein
MIGQYYDKLSYHVRVTALCCFCIIVGFTCYIFIVKPLYGYINSSDLKIDEISKTISMLDSPEFTDLDMYASNMLSSTDVEATLKLILAQNEELSISRFKLNGTKEYGKFYEHGFELVVEGDYKSCLAYLHSIETKEPRIFWKSVTYQVIDYPNAIMSLNMAVINLNKDWF